MVSFRNLSICFSYLIDGI
jgi:transformation/transcription domain-associated protein